MTMIVGTKFQLKRVIFIPWTKFNQKWYFPSRTAKEFSNYSRYQILA